MDKIMHIIAHTPAFAQENIWWIILVLIVFVGALFAYRVGSTDRRRETAERINSIDDYINDIKRPPN